MTKDSASHHPVVLQRQPSIYTLLGALQSALWFFALPPLCKPLWPIVFGNFSSSAQTDEVILWAIVFPYFLAYALLIALPPYLLQWEFFEQFKISTDPWPWQDTRQTVKSDYWKLMKRSMFIDAMNLVIGVPLVVYTKTILFPDRALSFSMDDWPNQYELSRDILLSVVLHEFGFYCTHRLFHAIPSLYKYHKVHHQYKQNNVLSAQHFHPIDFLASIAIPAILPTVVLCPHSFTQFMVGLWVFTANLDDHLGYAFPWTVVRWFPL